MMFAEKLHKCALTKAVFVETLRKEHFPPLISSEEECHYSPSLFLKHEDALNLSK